jgi:hypothetical protein
MTHIDRSRRDNPGLLTRPPAIGRMEIHRMQDLVADPVEQIKELAGLARAGLLSEEELELQKRRVLDD